MHDLVGFSLQLRLNVFKSQTKDLEAALSQADGNVAEAAGLLADGFRAAGGSDTPTGNDTSDAKTHNDSNKETMSDQAKIDYLMEIRDDVDRKLAQAALDAVGGDLEEAANDLLEGGGWVSDEVSNPEANDNEVQRLLDMGVTTNLDLAKHAYETANRQFEQAAELILNGLSVPDDDSNGTNEKTSAEKSKASRSTSSSTSKSEKVLKPSSSSSDNDSDCTDGEEYEQVAIETFLREQRVPEEHRKTFEAEGFAFIEDLVEADLDSIATLFEKLDLKTHVKTRLHKRIDALKHSKTDRRSRKPGNGRNGKQFTQGRRAKGGKPIVQAECVRDDEPLCSDEEDGLLAEALQLSIEDLAEGGHLEDEDEATEANQKWQELANVQKLLRMFGHELSTYELEKLQIEEDTLRGFLKLDPLPRRAKHHTQSMLPSGKAGDPSGNSGKKSVAGAKGKVKQLPRPAEENDEAASLRLAEQLEAQNQAPTAATELLTESEERTTMQVVQDFDLNIEEVFHVQTQLKQARGSAFTDAAELVGAVLNYLETMQDAELARCLQEADDFAQAQPQQQRARANVPDTLIKDSSSDSESSDEDARIKRRHGRVKKKPTCQQYRLPGAAAFKDHLAEGAFLRSAQHAQFYETVEEHDWQIHMREKAEAYRKKLESMQHRSIKQNNERRGAGVNPARQQRRNNKKEHAGASSQNHWKGTDWIPTDETLSVPPPPTQPRQPATQTDQVAMLRIRELEQQVAEMRRQYSMPLHQKIEQMWQQSVGPPGKSDSPSWADTAKKDTVADPNLVRCL